VNIPARHTQSAYMQFAKLRTHARYNLASSGVADCTLADLDLAPEDLALHGENAYGYAPLTQTIATRFAVPEPCVVTAGGGCSFTNHLALATLINPGDEVLVEQPTYELLISTLQYLQACIIRFERRPRDDWQLDPAAIAAATTQATRLIVLTNLHNPSSAPADDATISAIAAHAAKTGAHVLVDEVYRELLFTDGQAHTSFREHGNIVTTSSLTKAYGLSGLRCGWALAPAPVAARMRALNDLHGVLPPHITERMSVVAFDRLPALRARATAMIDANRAAYRHILGRHPRLRQTIFDAGTTVFPELTHGTGDALFEILTHDYETSLVPGSFFERPTHVRIGLAANPETTCIGFERLAQALMEL
jgi:aspartate/methionine/tyrosine aminotransferase